jgi:hypothetical protein
MLFFDAFHTWALRAGLFGRCRSLGPLSYEKVPGASFREKAPSSLTRTASELPKMRSHPFASSCRILGRTLLTLLRIGRSQRLRLRCDIFRHKVVLQFDSAQIGLVEVDGFVVGLLNEQVAVGPNVGNQVGAVVGHRPVGDDDLAPGIPDPPMKRHERFCLPGKQCQDKTPKCQHTSQVYSTRRRK